MTSGVPQGSVLRPIMFLLYINDLDVEVEGLVKTMKKFADDTKMGQKARMAAERERLQQALNSVCEWAERWGMAFNVQKCKVMHVGHNNAKQVYKMSGTVLTCVEEETDIGVKMANTLKPSAQCRKAAKTAQTVLSQLTRAFHYRDRHVFMRLYAQ